MGNWFLGHIARFPITALLTTTLAEGQRNFADFRSLGQFLGIHPPMISGR